MTKTGAKVLFLSIMLFLMFGTQSFAQLPDLQTWRTKDGHETKAIAFSSNSQYITLLVPKTIEIARLDEASEKAARSAFVDLDKLQDLDSHAANAAYLFAKHDRRPNRIVEQRHFDETISAIDAVAKRFSITNEDMALTIDVALEPLEKSKIDFRYIEILNALRGLSLVDGVQVGTLIKVYNHVRLKESGDHFDGVRGIDAALDLARFVERQRKSQK